MDLVPDKNQLFDSIFDRIKEALESASSKTEKLSAVCVLLVDNVPYYDWVGFYLVDESGKQELILGPYIGDPTEHVKISFGQGICGQAALRKETFIVQDVSKETNYLSCSPMVKSEIVVPIFKDGDVVGELDIDSHMLSPFSPEDKEFLEKICKLLSDLF